MDFYGFSQWSGTSKKGFVRAEGGKKHTHKNELMANSARVLIVICMTNNSELFGEEITSCTNINMPGRLLLCLEEL